MSGQACNGQERAEASNLGPFSQYAHIYCQLRLSIIPCGGEKGKKPLLKWRQYQKTLPYEGTIAIWAEKFPQANIGLITGRLSGITVLDSDDPERSLASLESEYGETPFVVQSPRGGLHLYYAYNQEKNQNGVVPKIDISGDGGYVIAPYSINPESQKSYTILKGTLADLKNLPRMRSIVSEYEHKRTTRDINGKIQESQRNNALFIAAKNVVLSMHDKAELLEWINRYNDSEMAIPLKPQEVKDVAESAWRYRQEGRIWLGSVYSCPAADFEKLSDKPDALALFLSLRKNHFDRKEFYIDQIKVALKLGWMGPKNPSRRRVREAIKLLIERHCIRMVKRGYGEGNPHVYSF